MDGSAIQQLRALAQEAVGRIHEIEGQRYSTLQLYRLRDAPALPTALQLHSLEGLACYVTANLDGCVLPPIFRVGSPQLVEVLGPVEGYARERPCWAAASVPDHVGPRLGKFQALDVAIVWLQASFADDDQGQRAALLKLVGNIRGEEVRQIHDDGVTQTVTVRAGVVRSGEASIPNPISLQPLRSFAEIDPLWQQFVVRVREGSQGVELLLEPVTDHRWEAATREQIGNWLVYRLEGQGPLILV
jgi:hypothetical protein